jgi:hypothetical protein
LQGERRTDEPQNKSKKTKELGFAAKAIGLVIFSTIHDKERVMSNNDFSRHFEAITEITQRLQTSEALIVSAAQSA